MTHNYVAELQKKFPNPLQTEEDLQAVADELERMLESIQQEAKENPEAIDDLRAQAKAFSQFAHRNILHLPLPLYAPVVVRIFNLSNAHMRFAAHRK